MKTKRSKNVENFIARAQANEDKVRARRVAILKHGLAQADFYDQELAAMEDIVFRAFGRTKIR